MDQSAANRQSIIVRLVRTSDLRGLFRLIDTAWRIHLRLAPHEIQAKIERIPAFVAEDRIGLRGFLMLEPLPSGIALFVAIGLHDTWSVKSFLDLMLPKAEEAAHSNNSKALVYIGNAIWLSEELEARGFETREWIVAFERQDSEPPPPPRRQAAQLRTAHYNDLPALLKLDNLAFEHIWHKSAGNFSEALARADSFTVALVDERIVAYQWCELYGKRAHLTRLAVHPAYQGRGIGAQLLHRAITDVLSAGADLITLNTQEANRRSQMLYKRFGFVNTKQRMPVLWYQVR